MTQLPFNLTYVQFLADHRNVFLTKLFLAASFVGAVDFYVLVAIFIYVLWDKQLAIRASVLVLLTMSLNHLLKIIIKNPRPFIREGTYPQKWGVSPADARERAAEYSTPSGHAMGASAFYSYLYALSKNRCVKGIAVLAIVLIGCSRPYLGVHYVEDILFGWTIGLALAVCAVKYADKLGVAWSKRSYIEQIGMTVAASILLCPLTIALHGWQIDEQSRSYVGCIGFVTGIIIARPLEWLEDQSRGEMR